MSDQRFSIAAKNPVTRALYFAAGIGLTALGIVGLILPVMPGTVFLILAAAAFARSSPRFERWLVEHPRFGGGVRLWREKQGIPRKIKYIAIGMMSASLVLMIAAGAPIWAALLTTLIMAAAAAFIATRPDA
jgi:uncharacterized membrane protein YbaN (DUF454 family)